MGSQDPENRQQSLWTIVKLWIPLLCATFSASQGGADDSRLKVIGSWAPEGWRWSNSWKTEGRTTRQREGLVMWAKGLGSYEHQCYQYFFWYALLVLLSLIDKDFCYQRTSFLSRSFVSSFLKQPAQYMPRNYILGCHILICCCHILKHYLGKFTHGVENSWD